MFLNAVKVFASPSPPSPTQYNGEHFAAEFQRVRHKTAQSCRQQEALYLRKKKITTVLLLDNFMQKRRHRMKVIRQEKQSSNLLTFSKRPL